MNLAEVLKDLSRACGVSGDERESTAVAERYLRPLVDEIHRDALGNLLGLRRSRRVGAKTVLLDAHLDEVGLMVTGADENLLKFSGGVGGVDTRMLPGLQVRVLTDPPVFGVITCGSPEQSEAAKKKPIPQKELRIDCGLTKETAARIPVGTRVAYATEPWSIGTRVLGKSMDDRACFLSLLLAMELTAGEDLPVHVAVLGSVREEQGGTGALVGTYGVAPDVALVTDVTFGDSPDSPKNRAIPLGSGAAIGYSPVLDRRYTKRLKALAEQYQIPYVQEVMEKGTGTNSMQTQIAGAGVPSVLISMPLRYMHTPVEEIDLRDVEAVARLTAAFIRNFDGEALQ